MKRIFTIVLILFSWAGYSQFNNSWIDYNKTYYKFKVAVTGIYRINHASLSAIGLENVPMEQLQLWRNGEEVTLYTTTDGVPGTSDYVEFWGERNDGRPDKVLYREARFQHSDKYSLYTDSASFFLTVNNSGNNLRFVTVANDVSAPPVAKENYFMYTVDTIYKTRINAGYAARIGEYVYSSAYDQGEFWSSAAIAPNATGLLRTFASLYPYTAGPAATIRLGASGNSLNQRNVVVKLGTTDILNKTMSFMQDSVYTIGNIPASSLSSGSASIRILNTSSQTADRMVVSFTSLTYPREFRFGNQTNFIFKLPASASGNYLEIREFSDGGTPPVIYDLTNRTRYVVNTATTGLFKVMLAPSAIERSLVMAGQQAVNIRTVSVMTKRKFIDLFNVANQAEYIIISNPLLYDGPNGNPVERYRDYRRSADGGSHKAIVYDIGELEDQFGFGINKHPLSIKNFLSFARSSFAKKPEFVLLIGRGVLYDAYYSRQADANAKRLNLIPTFGSPGSDNFLSAEGVQIGVPETPIGRLSVIDAQEIEDYLEKVKEYELAQNTPSCSVGEKAWMKNVMQVTGASDQYLGTTLCNYMNGYEHTLKDSLFGAKMHTFCKSTTGIGQEAATIQISRLFEEGVSILNYFGHSSATILEFSINDPESYNSQGKYPVFLVNGCNAGGFFAYDVTRLGSKTTLTEKFNLAKQRGAIAFVASTHFGVVSYLNIYIDAIYKMLGRTDYGNSLGLIHKDAMQRILNISGQDDYTARLHAEQISIHGDPALKFNTFQKPDYVVEEPFVRVSPSFLSIAESQFTVDVKLHNIGNKSGDSLLVKIMRTRPNNDSDTLYYKKIAPIAGSDSLSLSVPIVATIDKGLNKITVELDPENGIEEGCESNNVAVKDVMIYEDEARPIYPYAFSIVNKVPEKFVASTSNPFGEELEYVMQIDTTETFASSMFREQTVSSSGGILEFKPAVSMLDSTVYYWRTAVVPKDGGSHQWSSSSFVYLPASEKGWNQSHYYQFLKDSREKVLYGEDRQLRFADAITSFKFFMALYVSGPEIAPLTYLDDVVVSFGACGTYMNSLIFMAYDKKTGRQIRNVKVGNNGLFNSRNPVCPANGIDAGIFFYYSHMNAQGRRQAVTFLDSIQNDVMIAIWNVGSTNYQPNTTTFVNQWKADTTVYKDTALYKRLKAIGINSIDSFTSNKPFLFVLEKDKDGHIRMVDEQIGANATASFTARYSIEHPGNNGVLNALRTGTAASWKSLHWSSDYGSPAADQSEFRLFGVKRDNSEELLYKSSKLNQDTTLNFVDPVMYPQLKLVLFQQETTNHQPRILHYWQIKYDEVPEGGLSANSYFSTKDTVDVGEKVDFNIAFRNISETPFDSLRLKFLLVDRNNNTHQLATTRLDSLRVGESTILKPVIDTRQFPGDNTIYLEVNPDNDQPEQYHFNNFLYRNLYVRPDLINPLLDVTFDGVHILNRDIVSAKPHIAIKLKDEARFMPLSDTAAVTITLRYMESGGWTRTFKVDGDTLRFTPPSDPQTDNTALLEFMPHLLQDGEYELTVKGMDRSENNAGNLEYKVIFQTYNKPMISNMLNYPNPFTTSTAFVFTITGSEIPQNIRIQVLTVTGKVVREITKAELGPLRIGRNITEFKWDGTDQYGQKLANGVYLYRVLTNLNGKSLEKFTSEGENTDRFFTNGYGKMYLMR